MLFKNVASQKVPLFAKDTGATPVVGKIGDAANITAYVSKDLGAPVATTNAVVEAGGGWYGVELTQAETNANTVIVFATSTTPNIVIDGAGGLTTRGAVPSAPYGGTGGSPTYDDVTSVSTGLATSVDLADVQSSVDAIQGPGWDPDVHALDQTSGIADLVAAIVAKTLTALSSPPGATPTIGEVLMWPYHQSRYEMVDDDNAGKQQVKNDAGTVIGEAARSVAGGVVTREKFVAPPTTTAAPTTTAEPTTTAAPTTTAGA